MPDDGSRADAKGGAALPARLERLGRYLILEELGQGAMGTVYRAKDTIIERDVAIKVVRRPGIKGDPSQHEAYARFLREARAAGSVLHPNIVTVFDVGEDEALGVSFLAMEFVKGEPLDRLQRRRQRLSDDNIRSLALQILSALATAHAAGVVHRDIKPANLLLTESGVVKVADFGIAKVLNSNMTQDGTLLGSPNYMSPEQVRTTNVDHRTDLFSLAVVLYELVTRRSAFAGKTVYEVMQKVVQGDLVPAREHRPDIPADLEEAITRGLAREAADRFASAAAMAAVIKRPVDGGMAAEATLTPLVADVQPTLVRPGARAAAEPLEAAPPKHPPAPIEAAREASGLAALARRHRLALAAGLAAAALLAALGLSSVRAEPPTPKLAEVAMTIAAAGEPEPGAEPTALPASDTPAAEVEAAAPTAEAAAAPAPPAPPLRPRATPKPTAVPVVEAAPEPAAPAVEAQPLVSPFPHTVPVEHFHRLGSCHGLLTIEADRLSYASSDRDRDDDAWSYAELRTVDAGATEIRFTAAERDKSALGLKRKSYRFKLEGVALPAEIQTHLRERIDG